MSFVGSLYNEKAPFYKQLVEKLRSAGDHYTVGYLEAIIEAQLDVYKRQ